MPRSSIISDGESFHALFDYYTAATTYFAGSQSYIELRELKTRAKQEEGDDAL